MFRPIEKKRHVVLTIKTTNFHKYNPEEGDRLTQIACVEMVNGELTGNDFSTFVNLGDPQLLAQCRQYYREQLKAADADALTRNIADAPHFKDVQPLLLAYLNRDPNTKIIVHYKKGVLDFLRHAMDEAGNKALAKFTTKNEHGKDRMENMISKAAKLSHAGTYAGGRYPDKIDTGKEKVATTRSFYKFDLVCEEMGVSTRLRTDFSAVQDADMLARAERFRLQNLKPKKPAAVEAQEESTLATKEEAKPAAQPRRSARK